MDIASTTEAVAIAAMALCVVWYLAERAADALIACIGWVTRRERK